MEITPAQRRVAFYLAVGSTAAAVHWSVVVLLVGQAGWRPLVANLAGWLIAFLFSFAGHHRLTFRDHGSPVHHVAARFFAISAGGFVINESAYALLLAWGEQHYKPMLAVVLASVAVLTYVLSRRWAFMRTASLR